MQRLRELPWWLRYGSALIVMMVGALALLAKVWPVTMGIIDVQSASAATAEHARLESKASQCDAQYSRLIEIMTKQTQALERIEGGL